MHSKKEIIPATPISPGDKSVRNQNATNRKSVMQNADGMAILRDTDKIFRLKTDRFIL